MNIATIKWYDKEVCTNLLIKNLEDLLEYSKLAQQNCFDHIQRLLQDRIPVNRWDHYASTGAYGDSFNSALNEAIIVGGNPIFTVDNHHTQKMLTMHKYIERGEVIVINYKGGYCFLSDGIHKIISEQKYTPESPRFCVINENTKYINLENDPKLEKRTEEYMSDKDSRFSYVCYLHMYKLDELVEIFKEFQSKGGEIVYVYTTGTNVVQMWEYSKAIIKSGLKRVEFEFNSGYTSEHKEVVDYLKESGVSVEIVEDWNESIRVNIKR